MLNGSVLEMRYSMDLDVRIIVYAVVADVYLDNPEKEAGYRFSSLLALQIKSGQMTKCCKCLLNRCTS